MPALLQKNILFMLQTPDHFSEKQPEVKELLSTVSR